MLAEVIPSWVQDEMVRVAVQDYLRHVERLKRGENERHERLGRVGRVVSGRGDDCR